MLNPIQIQNSLTPGCKVSQIMPFLKIISQQQNLNLTKLSHYRRAKRILLISINQN
jgi:hypothetical protein